MGDRAAIREWLVVLGIGVESPETGAILGGPVVVRSPHVGILRVRYRDLRDVAAPGRIRTVQQVEEFDRYGIEPVQRNNAIGEWLAVVQRIVRSGAAGGGEIADPLRRGGGECRSGKRIRRLLQPLVSEEKEGLVLPYGAAEGRAGLVVFEDGHRLREKATRVHGVVAKVVPGRAVELVGAALRDGTEDGGAAPVLRTNAAGDDLYFLDGVRRGQE